MTPLALPPGSRLPDHAIWINGRIVRGDEAALSVFDRGARDGGGIFETLRVEGGRPAAWDRHLERLVLSAAELGFPVPPAPSRLRAGVDELLAASALEDAVVRLTVTRGIPGGRPTRAGAWIEAEPLAGRLWAGTRQSAGSAIMSRTPFETGWIGRHKTTSRLAWDLAREEARAVGVDEALLVGRSGHVLEGAASNVFVTRDGEVWTPPLSADVLPGVTRALVFALCAELEIPCGERMLGLAEIRAADEIFLTNSVQEVLPLAMLEGHPVRGRELGLKLLAAYRERMKS
ncbi:MAG TPA: aminotransferase class IV [Candidatus Acidoferrales bacterium]|nr:aminotransferase class IV [Candidatus Acidoferrales bacterium]